jgi:hypothetical protein
VLAPLLLWTFIESEQQSYYIGVLSPMAQLGNFLPDTIFISPSGHVVHVETGQYDTQGTLDSDIATYAYGVH